jgi:hypothetical protein
MDRAQYLYAGVNPFMIGIFYVSGALSFTQHHAASFCNPGSAII